MSTSEFNPKKPLRTNRPGLNAFENKIIVSTIILLIFNIIDIELTLRGMRLHLIEEGNPLMQLIIERNPLYLRTFKVLLPIILGTACWWVRDTSRKLIVYGMGLTLIVYLLIMLIHAYWLYTFF